MEEKIKAIEGLTLLAIVVGPIAAVFVTRFVDRRRERDGRRMDIFRTLMRTRRNPVWPEHVGALNLIEIEFQNDAGVMKEWRELFRHFGMVHSRRPDETLEENLTEEQKQSRTMAFNGRLYEERQRLLAKVLHAMGKVLRFKSEQLDIFEGGYTPQGWVDVELEQTQVRRYALDLAFARRLLPVGVFDYRQNPPQQVQTAAIPKEAKRPSRRKPRKSKL